MSDLDRVTVVDEPLVETIRRRRAREQAKPKRQPRYQVILWDDNDHSYDYVIDMMRRLFGHPVEKGVQIAKEVDARGRAICLTTTREHAELKRDQIHAFGTRQSYRPLRGFDDCVDRARTGVGLGDDGSTTQDLHARLQSQSVRDGVCASGSDRHRLPGCRPSTSRPICASSIRAP